MRKKIIIILSAFCCSVILFFTLHATPSIALRTHLFFTGHPVSALTTGIIDDELHNKIDKQLLESQNAKCYSLTTRTVDWETNNSLVNFKVTKKGLLYFAEYYGEA